LSCWKFFNSNSKRTTSKLFTRRAEDDDLEGLQENPRSKGSEAVFDVYKIVAQFSERVGDDRAV